MYFHQTNYKVIRQLSVSTLIGKELESQRLQLLQHEKSEWGKDQLLFLDLSENWG